MLVWLSVCREGQEKMDDDLRKWDAEVRGNISQNSPISSDSNLFVPPSVSRIKNSHRSLKSDNSFQSSPQHQHQHQTISSSDLALSINDHGNALGMDDGSSQDENQNDEVAPHSHYSGGRNAPPDQSFAATQLIHLTRGNTAYKIIESQGLIDDRGNTMDPITIVCLHGLTDSSYIWEDIAEVLSSSDAGPCARVVVFDFYGRGRSDSRLFVHYADHLVDLPGVASPALLMSMSHNSKSSSISSCFPQRLSISSDTALVVLLPQDSLSNFLTSARAFA
jgi:hypothetical protein